MPKCSSNKPKPVINNSLQSVIKKTREKKKATPTRRISNVFLTKSTNSSESLEERYFFQAPKIFEAKFPGHWKDPTAYKFLFMIYERLKNNVENICYRYDQVVNSLKDQMSLFSRTWFCKTAEYDSLIKLKQCGLSLKTCKIFPAGKDKTVHCYEYNFSHTTKWFLKVWKVEQTPEIPWTLFEFNLCDLFEYQRVNKLLHSNATHHVYQRQTIQMPSLPKCPPLRSNLNAENNLLLSYYFSPAPQSNTVKLDLPDSERYYGSSLNYFNEIGPRSYEAIKSDYLFFDRKNFYPVMINNAYCIVEQRQSISFRVVTKKPNYICVLQSDDLESFTDVIVDEFGKATTPLPKLCAPGERLRLLLISELFIYDQIMILVKATNSNPLPPSPEPSKTSANTLLCIREDAVVSGCASSKEFLEKYYGTCPRVQSGEHVPINFPQPVNNRIIINDHQPHDQNMQKQASFLNSEELLALPCTIKDFFLKKEITLENYEATDVCGRISINLSSRGKPSEKKWTLANINPTNIGKMRKCSIVFCNITEPFILRINASDSKVLALVNDFRREKLKLSELEYIIKPQPTPQVISFSFYPITPNKSSTVTITVRKPNSHITNQTCSETCVTNCLQEWKLRTRSHKFESSKSGLTEIAINRKYNLYLLMRKNNSLTPVLCDSKSIPDLSTEK